MELEEQWDDVLFRWRDGGKKLRSLRWFVTFAPTLAVSAGPGRAIHPKLGWASNPQGELNRKEKREGHGKLILSRLPGLRILSVDLGHRFAAACAVWEALTQEQAAALCNEFGRGAPKEHELFLHLTRKIMKNKKGNATAFDERIIVRRIAPHRIDGKEHPAPWARLDRQFLIKLQGEEHAPRAVGNDEEVYVRQFIERMGLKVDERGNSGRDVRELMAHAVRVASLALSRHGRRAKIAYALDPQTRIAHGIGGAETQFERGDATHVKLLTSAIVDWHSLASDRKWNDETARQQWNDYIAQGDFKVLSIKEPDFDPTYMDERSRPQRKADEEDLRKRLTPVAEQLVLRDRAEIHQLWKERWKSDDGIERDSSDFVPELVRDEKGKVIGSRTCAKRETSGFHADIRRLTDWIMGWHLPGAD